MTELDLKNLEPDLSFSVRNLVLDRVKLCTTPSMWFYVYDKISPTGMDCPWNSGGILGWELMQHV